MAAWLTYALVEYALTGLWPVLSSSDSVLMPWFWRGTEILFALYAVIGVGTGLLMGLLFAMRSGRVGQTHFPRTSLMAAGTLTLVLAFTANLLAQDRLQRSDLMGIASGIVLAANCFAVISSPNWANRFAFLAGPFTVSLLLFAAPWMNRVLFFVVGPWKSTEFLPHSTLAKLATTLSTMAMVAGFAWIASRSRAGHLNEAARSIRPSAGFMASFAGIAIFVVALGVAFNHGQPQLQLNGAATTSSRPNVVFLSLDTVRADHLSLYGYSRQTTPQLAALAQEAVVYDHTFAAADMTLASHASMFTGMYPRRHGAHYQPAEPMGRPLQDLPTLAEILSSNGYNSVGVVSNYAYLSALFGFQRGFQTYDYRAPVEVFDPNGTIYLRRVVRRLGDWFIPMEQFDRICRSAGEMNQEVFPILETLAQRETPFFLFVNYMDAHAPRMPAPAFKDRFPGRDPRLSSEKYYAIVKQVMTQNRKLSAAEHDSAIALYDGSIAYLDDEVGKLVTRLKQLGVYENTMIVITSDHGEAFGERDLMEHSVSVYQDQISVPLVIKYPNSREARREDSPVSHVDLLPTILDTLRLPLPAGVQGIDVRDIASSGHRAIISESYRNQVFAAWSPRFDRNETAMVSGNKKLIVSTAGKRELYDLVVDAQERTNLAQSGQAEATQLAEQLSQWMKAVVPPQATSVQAEKGNLQRLKSLGYVQ